jgi:hypothetical protein
MMMKTYGKIWRSEPDFVNGSSGIDSQAGGSIPGSWNVYNFGLRVLTIKSRKPLQNYEEISDTNEENSRNKW